MILQTQTIRKTVDYHNFYFAHSLPGAVILLLKVSVGIYLGGESDLSHTVGTQFL